MLDGVPLARFRIDTTDPGHPKVTVNDQEVPAEGFQLVHRHGELAQLTVVVRSLDGIVQGDGIVHVQVADQGPTGARAAVLEWLELLDAQRIEQQALDRQGWGSGGLGQEMLDVLKELAQEQLPE